MKRLWDSIVQNPKTTFAGIGTIFAVLAGAFGFLTAEQATAISFAVAGVGLILAGDSVVPPKAPK